MALGLVALGCDAGADDDACDGSACAEQDGAASSGDPAHPGGHDPGSPSSSSDSGTNPTTRSDSGSATDPGGASGDAGDDAGQPISELECDSNGDCPARSSLGECEKTACIDGMCAVVDDDDALPEDDGNECTEESCNAGVAHHRDEPSGTTCSQDGGDFCDGDGACVECVQPSQCDSDVCQDGECRPELCGNEALDPGETDVDCGGGDCGGCGPDAICDVNEDCVGNECPAGTCVPNCDDGVLNHGESAIDCGEVCPDALCADSSACGSDDDCESGYCNPSSLCSTPSCTDGIENGTETAIDCGGTTNGVLCPVCPTACTDNWECGDTAVCYDGHCASDVNGCTIANSTDFTGMVTASQSAPITINFPIGGNNYSPRCIKVTMGTKIRFEGTFANHPLVGGLITAGAEHPVSAGPFTPRTDSGTSKDIVMDDCAAYPFYCDNHGGGGMNGAVIVLLP
jgi:plastocyanin